MCKLRQIGCVLLDCPNNYRCKNYHSFVHTLTGENEKNNVYEVTLSLNFHRTLKNDMQNLTKTRHTLITLI